MLTIFGLASWIFPGLYNHFNTKSNYQLLFLAKFLATPSLLCFHTQCDGRINGASSIFGLTTSLHLGLCMDIDYWSIYCPSLCAKILVTILLLSASKDLTAEWQQFICGSASYTATNCLASFLNWVFNGQSFQYILVYNITTMHAMNYRPFFYLACSSRVSI